MLLYRPTNSAFTLIELLTTLIILGIVATFAIPSYNKYILRSRVNAMYEAATAAKFIVADDYNNQGQFPSYGSNTTPFTKAKADYIASISIDNGIITITGVSSKLQNKSITLTLKPKITPANQVAWQCCISSINYFDYAPPECRNK